jgi:hypothetical protein
LPATRIPPAGARYAKPDPQWFPGSSSPRHCDAIEIDVFLLLILPILLSAALTFSAAYYLLVDWRGPAPDAPDLASANRAEAGSFPGI